MTLAELRRGDIFRIVKITIEEEIGKRLVDMGLNQGVQGMMLRCALLGDPIEIRIRDYNLSLRKAEAAGINVELVGWNGCRKQHGRHRGWRWAANNSRNTNGNIQ